MIWLSNCARHQAEYMRQTFARAHGLDNVVVAGPYATDKYTVEDLTRMELVGIYRMEESNG